MLVCLGLTKNKVWDVGCGMLDCGERVHAIFDFPHAISTPLFSVRVAERLMEQAVLARVIDQTEYILMLMF